LELFGQDFYKIFQPERLILDQSWKWQPHNKKLLTNTKKLLAYKKNWDFFLARRFSHGYHLVLAPYGLQTGLLLQELKKRKKPFLYINWDEFIREGIVFYESKKEQFHIRIKKNVFDLKKVKNIFIDYTDLQEVFHYKRANFNFKEQLFIGRWLEALKTLEFILADKKWWPAKPSQMKSEGQNKFGELLIAKKMGFLIPNMIFTNEPREAQRFLFHKDAVLKESGVKNYFGPQRNLMLETTRVNALNKKLARVDLAPCMFQEFIEKKYDVRAIVIGKKTLAIKIESQTQKSKTDWRRQEGQTPMSRIILPHQIQKRLIRFANKNGFSFASFDLVVDQKNRFYLLEMNRPGQWFFLETLSGAPIAKTLVQNF